MKKPVGRTGAFVAKVIEDGSVHGSYEQIEFTNSKSENEQLIADWFIEAMTQAAISVGDKPMFSNVKPNTENHFDFTVSTTQGTAYLELQEVAPLSGPYKTALSQYKPYDFAHYILSKIREKSIKYSNSGIHDIFLLIYFTHWSFAPSTTTVACLRVWLQQEQLIFKAIFLFTPLSWGEGVPSWLYPTPPELRVGFDPESVRDTVCLNLDSEKFQMIHTINEV